MTKCISCGAAGQDGKFCEDCGKPLTTVSKVSNETPSSGHGPQILAVAVAVVAVMAFVFLLTPNNGSAVETTDTGTVTASGTVPTGTVTGTPASGNTQTLTVSIQGMTCGGCVAGIEKKVGALNGIVSVDVYLREKKGIIVYDSELLSKQTIIDTITNYGYPASELSDAAGSVAPTPAPSTAGAESSCGAGGGGCGCGG